MTIKEIIEIESANESCINLYKEGIFWRAYNQSAMRLVNNLKYLKIIRKYVKNVKQDIFYCGFPDSSLQEIKNKSKEQKFIFTETNDTNIIISNISSKEDYKNWIENQPTHTIDLTGFKNLSGLERENQSGLLVQQIQQYPLENATPMETMLFVQKLKQSIINNM